MAEGQTRGGERAEAEAPHVDGSAACDAVDQVGHVVGEALDRHRPAGVRGVAVALEFDLMTWRSCVSQGRTSRKLPSNVTMPPWRATSGGPSGLPRSSNHMGTP